MRKEIKEHTMAAQQAFLDKELKPTNGKILRTEKVKWAESKEELLLSLSPLPIAYDTSNIRTYNFAAFNYTEFIDGIYLKTESVNINTRMINDIIENENDIIDVIPLVNTSDKYKLETIPNGVNLPKQVVFLPGSNLMHMVSLEYLCRIVHENEFLMVKPHPLTDEQSMNKLASMLGWDRIIEKDFSGHQLLFACEEAWITTTTEMAAACVIMNKKIHNVSSFLEEGVGGFYAINNALTKSKNPKETLNKILNCKWSGLLMPYMDDIEERSELFFEKALEYRNRYKEVVPQFSNLKPLKTKKEQTEEKGK